MANGGPEAVARWQRRRVAQMVEARSLEQLGRARYLARRSQRVRRANRALLPKRTSIPRYLRHNRALARREAISFCKWCKAPFQQKKRGRLKEFCSDACRAARFRSRNQWVAEQIARDQAEHAQIQRFETLLTNYKRQRSKGGPIAQELVKKYRVEAKRLIYGSTKIPVRCGENFTRKRNRF